MIVPARILAFLPIVTFSPMTQNASTTDPFPIFAVGCIIDVPIKRMFCQSYIKTFGSSELEFINQSLDQSVLVEEVEAFVCQCYVPSSVAVCNFFHEFLGQQLMVVF